MQTAVVTGGAGFLGSHLCDKLLSEGLKVICIDNLITGNIDNISHLAGNENFSFIKHDITNYIFIPGKVDYILHFASPASPVDYLQLPIQTLKVGSLGTHKALGLAKEKKARFLLASTSEVYGDPEIHPQPEEYWGNVNPIGPRGVYDEAIPPKKQVSPRLIYSTALSSIFVLLLVSLFFIIKEKKLTIFNRE